MNAAPRHNVRLAIPDQPRPDTLRPMLPTVVDEPFDSPDHIFEVKWGGVRAIAELDDGRVRLHGRNLRDLTPLYPELEALARALPAAHAVVDGEIVALGDESLPSFDLLRPRLLRPDDRPPRRRDSGVVFQVFDLLELDGRWLLRHPLYERRNLLHERLAPQRSVQAADFIRDDGIAFFEAVMSHRLEGVIAKDKSSPYFPGQRSPGWREIRAIQADDFVVGGYSFGGGLRNDPIGSLFLGAEARGRLDFVGEVSVGCTDTEARQLLALLTPLHTDHPPFADPPEVQRFYYWCRPELAVHVRYSQWTPEGRLRFPVFVAPRPDVPAQDCVRDAV